MMNKQQEAVLALFDQSDINRRWWFTKYGYYLLYREGRFLFALIAQIISVIFAIGGFVMIILVMRGAEIEYTMVTAFLVASIANSLSECFIYHFAHAAQWLLMACAIYFVVYRFI